MTGRDGPRFSHVGGGLKASFHQGAGQSRDGQPEPFPRAGGLVIELAKHGRDCGCQRCGDGFSPGNEVAVRHGAYAVVRLGHRAAEIADELRPLIPGYTSMDEPALRILAFVLARLEAASAALDAVDATSEGRELAAYTAESAPALQRLREDARGWTNTARRLLNDLCLTTASRAKAGLHLAQTESTLVSLCEAGRRVREERPS